MSSNSSGRGGMKTNQNSTGLPLQIENSMNPSLNGTVRTSEKQTWNLKTNNIPAETTMKANSMASFGNNSNSRPDSKKLAALNRPPTGTSPVVHKQSNSQSEIIALSSD